MSDLRRALEQALIDNPDDEAAHRAYADLLIEQGDPRGEFISVQLALEDSRRSTKERKALQRREREILDAHEREWLGELVPLLLGDDAERLALLRKEMTSDSARYFNDQEPLMFQYGWWRGWLDRFECDPLSVETARKLGRHPLARLLRGFVCRWPWGVRQFRSGNDPSLSARSYTVEVLEGYPVLGNLRFFQYGEEVDPEEDRYDVGTQYERLAPLIERMPRLEELRIFGHIYDDGDMWRDLHRILSLPTLTNLRVYQHYHGTTYALESLAANPALGRLTHLLIFPHSFARYVDPSEFEEDNYVEGELSALHRENVRAVLTSPHLSSLTHLQLRCCNGGDGMIEDVISSGILKRLKVLDLRHGHVSDVGARRLARCPDTSRLEVLDLINNRLTVRGITDLKSAGVKVRADRQQTAPFEDDRILYFGDSE
jgi:uncharacterized protein (TIGR02996 family)